MTELTTKTSALKSETLGFKVRGQPMTSGAPVAMIPDSLEGADVSVCGVKGFMLDETREFQREDGSKITVDCASVAALEIADSPVHVHGVTQEVYTVLDGKGRMVLGDKVVDIQKGSVVLLPPGVEHGLTSDNPDHPVKVLLTFTPGIAPKQHPEFRDEAILYLRTTDRIAQLSEQVREAATDVVEG